MTEPKNSGAFAKFSLVVQTLGSLGVLVAVAVYLLLGQGAPMASKGATVKETKILEMQATNIENQKLIIQTLNEIQKITLRQSMILDNVVSMQEYMIRNQRRQ